MVGLIEVDPAGPRLSWVFPSLFLPVEGSETDDDQRKAAIAVLAMRAQLLREEGPPGEPVFTFSRWRGRWWYSIARARRTGGESPDVVHPVVSGVAIILGSSIFDPERNHGLLTVLLRAFEAEGGSPPALLQRVLAVATKGVASAPGGPDFVSRSADPEAAKCGAATPFGALLRQVGAEGAATLWAAMMLRARVAVFASTLPQLLSVVRCLPLFAWHRYGSRLEAVLRPLCCLSAAELTELEAAGAYAAGFVDPAILGRPALYDVLLDCRSGDVRITPPSAGGRLVAPPRAVVKQVAKALEQGTESGTELALVDTLAAKTAEMVESAADAARPPAGDEPPPSLPPGVEAFLRALHDAETIASAGA